MNKNLSKQLKEQQADKILLQAIAASADADAFLILYNRYSQRLLQYFYNVTDNADTGYCPKSHKQDDLPTFYIPYPLIDNQQADDQCCHFRKQNLLFVGPFG